MDRHAGVEHNTDVILLYMQTVTQMVAEREKRETIQQASVKRENKRLMGRGKGEIGGYTNYNR